jgi:hypothetical protein
MLGDIAHVVKSWSTSQTKLTDLASLEPMLNDAARALNSESLLWRGHAEEDWTLRPAVFRETKAMSELRSEERSRLWYFMMQGSPRITNAPLISDHLTWLYLAQHYGLPTRLLDWTWNALVALFFAVELHPEKDGCLWALDTTRLHHAQNLSVSLFPPTDEPFAGMVEAAFADPKPSDDALPIALATSAKQADLRMLVQDAAFTIHSNQTDLREVSSDMPSMRRFVIPANSKMSIKYYLEQLGIHQASIYPDLAHLAAHLKTLRFIG